MTAYGVRLKNKKRKENNVGKIHPTFLRRKIKKQKKEERHE